MGSASAPPTPLRTAKRGKTLLTAVINRLRSGLPAGLAELATLGRRPVHRLGQR